MIVQVPWLLSIFHLPFLERSDFVKALADLNGSERDDQGGGWEWEAIRE